jgi:hypothetical protein
MNLIDKIFKKDDNFGIIIRQNKEFDFTGVQYFSPVLRLDIENLLKPKPLLTQADPFLFVKEKTLFLFYESQRSGERGIIRMMKTDNLHDWTSPVTVLQEPYHLSFPFVFEYDGDVYMIPESQEDDSIRLYKGNANLSEFKLKRILFKTNRVENVKFGFCDSHLLLKDGIFYLFTSVSYNWTYHLELYYTDDILHHSFVKHPESPIYIGNDFGRSGGSIIHLDGDYYRISQNCNNSYGANISVHRITTLDKTNYREILCNRDIFDNSDYNYRDGGHQLNIVKYGDDYIYATDYRKVSWCWYQFYLRLRRFL